MAEGITLATAITIRPIVRLHRILTLTIAVLVTSCVPMVASDQRSSAADAGNSVNSTICLEQRTRGESQKWGSSFCLWIDRLQIIHFLACIFCVGYFPLGTFTDIATNVDDKNLVCHVYFTQMHVVKHFLRARLPHLFIAGMPKQAYADDNTAFQCQSFLNFKKLFLETGASAKCDDFVVLYHFNTFGNYTLPSTLSSAPHSDW